MAKNRLPPGSRQAAEVTEHRYRLQHAAGILAYDTDRAGVKSVRVQSSWDCLQARGCISPRQWQAAENAARYAAIVSGAREPLEAGVIAGISELCAEDIRVNAGMNLAAAKRAVSALPAYEGIDIAGVFARVAFEDRPLAGLGQAAAPSQRRKVLMALRWGLDAAADALLGVEKDFVTRANVWWGGMPVEFTFVADIDAGMLPARITYRSLTIHGKSWLYASKMSDSEAALAAEMQVAAKAELALREERKLRAAA